MLHTPGHSPGSLTYVFDEFAVVGDTLFNNGIGRTDLYKGDYETLVDSIQDKIFELEGDLPLFPGHGPYTTVDDEQLNPFYTVKLSNKNTSYVIICRRCFLKILFQEIINKAIEMKASDVHFIPVKMK